MATTSVEQSAGRVTTRAHARYWLSIETAGLLTLLFGAWGGIVPYIGPVFGYSGDGTASWTWNLAHGLMFLFPGAVACAAGMLIMIEAISTGPARRFFLAIGGLLAVVCGAWFVIGPSAWPALQGTAFFTGAPALRELAYWIGYSLGPGGVLLILGAFILGRPGASDTVID